MKSISFNLVRNLQRTVDRSLVHVRPFTTILNLCKTAPSNPLKNRVFSSYPPTYNELSSILSDQIIDEEGAREIDQDHLDLVKLVGLNFKIVDSADDKEVVCVRTLGKEQIFVFFSCVGEREIPESLEDFTARVQTSEDQEQDEMDFEDSAGGGVGIEFFVIVKSPIDETVALPPVDLSIGPRKLIHLGRENTAFSHSLAFNCVAAHNLRLEHVQYIAPNKASNDMSLYGGPGFQVLPEDVRQAFADLLISKGIDDDFVSFVLSKANDKEDNEYLRWLINVNGAVSK